MPKDDQTTQKCPRCSGRGRILDAQKTGRKMRAIRETHHVSLRCLASKMGISHQFLTKLEHGEKGWTTDKIASFKMAITKVLAERHKFQPAEPAKPNEQSSSIQRRRGRSFPNPDQPTQTRRPRVQPDGLKP